MPVFLLWSIRKNTLVIGFAGFGDRERNVGKDIDCGGRSQNKKDNRKILPGGSGSERGRILPGRKRTGGLGDFGG